MATAVVCVGFQNRYAKPEGALHDVVAEVMNENDMLPKAIKIVQEARSNSALVIHSPTLDDTHWDDEIVDEVLSESDIVLGERATISRWSTITFDGADLCTTIEDNGVKSVILIGFLSNKAIVGAAILLSDNFPDLLIMVCSDVTADERKRHECAMEKALPVIGIHVITYTEAIGIFKMESHDQARQSLEKKNSALAYTWKGTGLGSTIAENETLNKKLFNVYEFQSILRAACVLVPSDVLVKVFRQANAKHGNDGGDCFSSFSLIEINEVLHGLVGNAEGIPVKALTGVLLDLPSVCFFLAGLLLLIGLFTTAQDHGVAFSLIPNGMYLIGGSISAVGMPLKDWNEMQTVYNNVRRCRASTRMKAAAYQSRRDAGSNDPLDIIPTARTSQFLNQLRYIQDVIYSNSTSEALTKSEVEMLLLQQLGTAYTSRTLDYVISTASHSNSSTINPVEMHYFIATEDTTSSTTHYLDQAWSVFKNVMLSPGYLMNLCFFIALAIAVIQWTLRQFGINPDIFAYTWLYVLGTAGFSELAYERVRYAYDLKSRTKHLIEASIRYAQYHNTDKPVWQRFNQEKLINVNEFSKLLESSDVLLSEAEVDDLIKEIDATGNNCITEEELESYLNRGSSGRQRAIFFNCLRNFSFVSNLSWLIGAIGFTTAYYSSGTVQTVSDRVGVIGYFMGGTAYACMVYSVKRGDLEWRRKMKYAIKCLLRTNSRRTALWSRLSQKQSDFDGDDEMPDLNEELTQYYIPNPLEDFLSSLISCTFESVKNEGLLGTVTFLSELEWTSSPHPTTSSLLMYQVTLKSCGEQYTGFMIIPCFCDEEDMAKISANISEDGSKLLLGLPRYRPPLQEGIEDPSKLYCKYFSPECMEVFFAEAKLPWSVNSKSRVSSPTLIYSHGRTRSVVHFQLEQYNQGACLDNV